MIANLYYDFISYLNYFTTVFSIVGFITDAQSLTLDYAWLSINAWFSGLVLDRIDL